MTARSVLRVLAAALGLCGGWASSLATAQEARSNGPVHLPDALEAGHETSSTWMRRPVLTTRDVGPRAAEGFDANLVPSASFAIPPRKLGEVSRVVSVAGQDVDLNGGIGKRGAYAEVAIEF